MQAVGAILELVLSAGMLPIVRSLCTHQAKVPKPLNTVLHLECGYEFMYLTFKRMFLFEKKELGMKVMFKSCVRLFLSASVLVCVSSNVRLFLCASVLVCISSCSSLFVMVILLFALTDVLCLSVYICLFLTI